MNPDVITMEASNKLLLTFLNEDLYVFEVDNLAQQVLRLLVNGFPMDEILEICKEVYVGPESDKLPELIDSLVKDLTEKKLIVHLDAQL